LNISKKAYRCKIFYRKWQNEKYISSVGFFVVRNRFRIPKSPFDGDKIYSGKDNFTYDGFGSLDIAKYYAIFNYDNIPNHL
jgi:hypothetical protein